MCIRMYVPYHVLGTVIDLIIWTNISSGALYGMDKLEELWRYCNVVCVPVWCLCVKVGIMHV